MGITEGQRERRRSYIGGSDIASLFGANPWKSASDVWAEKVFPTTDTLSGNEAVRLGVFLEPSVLALMSDEAGGETIVRNQFRVEPKDKLCAAHLDAIAPDVPCVYEAKVTGQTGEWGDPGTDIIPDRVIWQVQHGLLCLADEVAFARVGVLMPGWKRLVFSMYMVYPDLEMHEMIRSTVNEFWEKYVEPETPPDDYRPNLEVLKSIRREGGLIAELSEEDVRAWNAFRSTHTEHCKVVDDAKAKLITQLGLAERGRWGGDREITYFLQRRHYFGKGDKYQDHKCEHCGVGTMVSESRTLRERKARD